MSGRRLSNRSHCNRSTTMNLIWKRERERVEVVPLTTSGRRRRRTRGSIGRSTESRKRKLEEASGKDPLFHRREARARFHYIFTLCRSSDWVRHKKVRDCESRDLPGDKWGGEDAAEDLAAIENSMSYVREKKVWTVKSGHSKELERVKSPTLSLSLSLSLSLFFPFLIFFLFLLSFLYWTRTCIGPWVESFDMFGPFASTNRPW